MKVALIDDELNSLILLEALLKPYKDIQVMGKFTHPDDGFRLFENEKIDLVFLDIEMGAIHGIDVAKELVIMYPSMEIVFVTAHSEFAVEAFEINVVDYLLKPLNPRRLAKSIKRAQEKLSVLKENERLSSTTGHTFIATTFGKFHLFDLENQIIKWRTRKGRELFVLLWRHHKVPIDKEYIIDTLWPDMSPDKATALLYTTMYQVRKALGGKGIDNPVKLVGEDYQLQISIDSDYEEFRRILGTFKTTANIERGLILYKDNFLQEYDWALSERHILQNEYLAYLRECTLLKTIKIEPQLKRSCLEKMVQVDPLNEEYVSALLSHYFESGDDGSLDALYCDYESSLEELGLEVPNSFKGYLKI